MTAPAGPTLSVAGLTIGYRVSHGLAAAVRDVTFEVGRGEILGIVGETGCGKSTVLRAVIGLLHPSAQVMAGRITVAGRNVVGESAASLQQLRSRHVAMVFQDPLRALNPVLTVEEQIGEALKVLGPISRQDQRRRVLETMTTVGISDAPRRLRAYPHELSGGMQQRVVIAAAVIRSPELLLADEPTTALDVTIQDQILTLLGDLCRSLGMSLVLVTHDIGVVADRCDRVGVMYAGRLIESGSVPAVLGAPSHPYTSALLGAIPRIDAPRARLRSIPGSLPDPTEPIEGCPFAPRCDFVLESCRTTPPTLEAHAVDQLTACLRHRELGPELLAVTA